MQSEIWGLEDKVDNQVSWRAIRSGGREQEARSPRAMEFLGLRRDRMLMENRRNFLVEDLVAWCKEPVVGPGFVSMSPDKSRVNKICRNVMADE